MARVRMKELTSPVHGPGGALLHNPGDLFPADHEFGPDVRWRPVLVDVPDEPPPAAAPVQAKAGTAEAKGSARK